MMLQVHCTSNPPNLAQYKKGVQIDFKLDFGAKAGMYPVLGLIHLCAGCGLQTPLPFAWWQGGLCLFAGTTVPGAQNRVFTPVRNQG